MPAVMGVAYLLGVLQVPPSSLAIRAAKAAMVGPSSLSLRAAESQTKKDHPWSFLLV
jgi:hypothetical protein